SAREVDRKADHELHLAAPKRVACRVLARELADELEIAARAHRGEVAARELALLGADDRGRQVLRLGVDRVAEEEELDDRDADDHPERDAVAPELQELLVDDSPPAVEREASHRGAPSASAELAIRWMKTSSRPVSAGAIRLAVSAVARRSATSTAAASPPVTCNADPNAATCSTPGSRSSRVATAAMSPPCTLHVASFCASTISAAVPSAISLPYAM